MKFVLKDKYFIMASYYVALVHHISPDETLVNKQPRLWGIKN
jgi:hypothetical protein